VTNTVRTFGSLSNCSPTPQRQSKVLYPIAHYANCEKFSVKHCRFLASMTMEKEPMTFSEAIKDKR